MSLEQTALGSFGLELHETEKKSFSIGGVECPECGSIQTRCRRAGYDDQGNRLRKRECDDCDKVFNTVEVVADYIFNRVDTAGRERNRERNEKRHRKYLASTMLRRPARETNDTLNVTVTVHRAPRGRRCYLGKHYLTAATTYITPDGYKRCKQCRREASRERSIYKKEMIKEVRRRYWEKNGARINAKKKADRLLQMATLAETT